MSMKITALQSSATEASNKIFDAQSKTYGYDLDEHFPAQTRLNLLAKHCNQDMNILDVACANGLYSVRIAPKIKSVTAIDISQDMLVQGATEATRIGVKNAKFINMNGCDFDFGDQKFDLIFCYAAIVVLPDMKGFFESCHRNLKEGGILIVDVLNRNNLSYPYWSKWYASQGYNHYNVFSKAAISSLLNDYGFAPQEFVRQGFAEQWKYIPGLNRLSFIEKIIHWGPKFDLDYILSNIWPFSLASNRWYIVARKK